jgi:phage/plasmid-associated DNA primase
MIVKFENQCKTCEELKLIIDDLRVEKEKLLNAILQSHQAIKIIGESNPSQVPTIEQYSPRKTARMRMAELEARDRAEFESLNLKQETERLERELNIVQEK